jgi:hypothetical protein
MSDHPTLQDLIKVAGMHARAVMIELNQGLMPTWLYWGETGAIIMGTPWDSEIEKKVMAMAVRRAMLKDNATAYSMVTEAWVASAPKGWNPETDTPIRASEQPNRREVVIAFATDGETTEWKRWAIKRDALEMVTDLEEEPFDYEKINSWMTRLLNTK